MIKTVKNLKPYDDVIWLIRNFNQFCCSKNLFLLGAGCSKRYIENSPDIKKELNMVLYDRYIEIVSEKVVDKNTLKESEIARHKLKGINIVLHETSDGKLLGTVKISV